MSWYTYPSFIVAILAIITTIWGKKDSEDENIKKNILVTVIKGVLISIPILILEMLVLYFFNSYHVFYRFWNEIFLPYAPNLYLIITFSVTLVLFLFPYFSKESISFEKYSDKYLLESKLSYNDNFNIELFYFIENSRYSRKLLLLKNLIRIFIFLSFMVVSIFFLIFFQQTDKNDSKYPYRTNEKIFIKTTECIPISTVKNKNICIQSIPKGTLFSISKGTNFNFDHEDLNMVNMGEQDVVYNEVYGLPINREISLDSHSKIYFEQEIDYTLYKGDKDGNIDKYYQVKTVPGKTNRNADSKVKYTVVSDPTRKSNNEYYEFVVGYTTNDISYTKFLQNVISFNSIIFIFIFLLTVIFIPIYLYVFICVFILLILIILSFVFVLENNTYKWYVLLLPLALLLVKKMFSLRKFLKYNLAIRRNKSVKEINIKITAFKKKIFIDDKEKDNIDITEPFEDSYPLKFSLYDENNNKNSETDKNNTIEFRIYFYNSILDLFKIINKKNLSKQK